MRYVSKLRVMNWIVAGIAFASANAVWAANASAPVAAKPARAAVIGGGRAPASMHGVTESDKPLRILGQSRNINMTLVLKGDKDEIHFVKPRTSFQDKIAESKF